MASENMQPTKSKIAAGIFGILLGALGIHKFYLGYVGAGIVHLVLTLPHHNFPDQLDHRPYRGDSVPDEVR